jgi:chromosome partitioning protein
LRGEGDRLTIPVWSGQISNRAAYLTSLAAGMSAGELAPDSPARNEVARLWSAVERSVAAINGAHASGSPMHDQAA